MTAPDSRPGTPSYSPLTKLVVVVVLAAAIGAFVLAYLTAQTGSDDAVNVSGAPGEAVSAEGVQALIPGEGARQVHGQQRVGIQLADGWTGELMLLPPTGTAIPLPLDELDAGPRNEILYTPGAGKSVERLPTGRTCMRATIWSQVRGREGSERVEQWCFTVV